MVEQGNGNYQARYVLYIVRPAVWTVGGDFLEKLDTDADTCATKLGENLLCRLRAAAGLDQDHQDADV